MDVGLKVIMGFYDILTEITHWQKLKHQISPLGSWK